MVRSIIFKIFTIWEDLLRYPRFFISSMIGLVLILLTPIINQLKKVNDKKLIYIFLIISLILLFLIIKEMVTFE